MGAFSKIRKQARSGIGDVAFALSSMKVDTIADTVNRDRSVR